MLTGLQKFTSYHVRMYVMTNSGHSPWSQTRTVQTQQDGENGIYAS